MMRKLSSPVIANLRLMKNNHNLASTAISILSSVEYDEIFHLPTQDLSTVSSRSSCSDESVVIAHTKTTRSNWKRICFILTRPLLSVSSIDSPSPLYKQTKENSKM